MSQFATNPAARLWLTAAVAAAVFLPSVVSAQPSPAAGPGIGRHVVAKVDDREILRAEVNWALAGVPPIADETATAKRFQLATRLMIERAIALDYLAARKLGATKAETDLAYASWRDQLVERGSSDQEFYLRSGLDEASMRRQFAWSVGWKRYTDRHLHEEAMKTFFDKHHREFDGTRLRVAHILLPVMPSVEDNLEKATQLRTALAAGDVTFEEAAKQHSKGTTAVEGGELGWITAQGPMDPTFTAAALSLNPGELSVPVKTNFGIHLIRCLEVEAGTKVFDDVRDAVLRAAEVHLFKTSVARQISAGNPSIQIMSP